MAPLLFLIYINDIPNSIANMLRLYAALLYFIINLTTDCILTYLPYKNGVKHGQPIVNTFRLYQQTGTTILLLSMHYMGTPYKK